MTISDALRLAQRKHQVRRRTAAAGLVHQNQGAASAWPPAYRAGPIMGVMGRDRGGCQGHRRVLHGVYSWVAPEVRRDIARVLRDAARPGGYVFVSYNALPGWSQKMPLREMMLRASDGRENLSSTDPGAARPALPAPAQGQQVGLLRRQPRRRQDARQPAQARPQLHPARVPQRALALLLLPGGRRRAPGGGLPLPWARAPCT